MVNVLMYGWEFPPHISGGLGVACHGIVNGLAENNVNVAIVLPCLKASTPTSGRIHFYDCKNLKYAFTERDFVELNQRIKIQLVNSPLLPYIDEKSYQNILNQVNKQTNVHESSNTGFCHFNGDYGKDLFSEVIRYALVAGKYALDVPHDVIHAHDWLTILAGLEAKRISNKPLIFHVHALETDRNPGSMNNNVFNIEKYGMQHADEIIAVSEYTKKCIQKYYAIPGNKITVVHNGISPEQLCHDTIKTEQSARNTVLFLGRSTQQKGPYQFIDVAHRILQVRKDVDFVIAGDGDLWHGMVERVAALKIGTHVHFTKFLNRIFTAKIFSLSKVFVMPSLSEPFGLVSLEAIAQRIPVILSKQSGVVEVIKNCLTVDYWDTNKMATQISALLDYPTLAKHLVDGSYEELKNLSWSHQTKKIIEIYKTTLGQP